MGNLPNGYFSGNKALHGQIADELNFFSDASANEALGFGAIFGNRWLFGKWEPDFVNEYKPSIEFLELFALCAGVFAWGDDPNWLKPES